MVAFNIRKACGIEKRITAAQFINYYITTSRISLGDEGCMNLYKKENNK